MRESSTSRPEAKVEKTTRFAFQTFSSLRYPDYRHLWTGTLLMSAGQWIQQVTLGWLLYDLTGSSVLLGLLNGFRTVPFLFSSPLAGVAADRMDRKVLMLRAQYVLVATALAMGVLVGSGLLQVWHLFLFTLITGTAWSFAEPVRHTLVPHLVPKKELMNAVALHSSGFHLMKVVGPAVGGFLIAFFGVAGNFFVQAAAYAGVLVTIHFLHVPSTQGEGRHSSVFADLKEVFAYIASTPTVLIILAADLAPRIFAVPYHALLPIFQKDVFRVGPEGLGMMLAAPGFGAVLSTLLLASLSHRLRRRYLILPGGLLLLGIALILFSRADSFSLALLALVGVGACQLFFMATTNTLLQMVVPDALRGRVMSIYMLDRGFIPAGSLLAGVSAHYIGAPATVSVMGLIVIILATLVVFRLPLLRQIEG
ncbi:MAG: MFS transporter [Deltaproteobacteria bacterium]|nr:MFS transporter [Deltaproteobacteria bacterium]